MTTGTDARRYDFILLDNESVDDYDLTPYEGWLYVVIVRLINHEKGVAFPSLATLAVKSKMSKPMVVKCLKALEAKRLIKIEQQKGNKTNDFKPNHYTVLPVPKKRKVVNEVDNVVNGVNDPCQPGLQGVVNEVYSKKIDLEKDDSKKIEGPAPMAQDSTEEKPKRKRSAAQIRLDDMKNALADAFGLEHSSVTGVKWDEFGGAGKQLLGVGATPEDMKSLHAHCTAKGWTDFTSYAMAKEWAGFCKVRDYESPPLPTSGVDQLSPEEVAAKVPGGL